MQNKYKISKIYDSENWNATRRSPLTAPGVDVNEGDYLVAINGKEISIRDNPYSFLENLAGKRTEITVSGSANGNNPRTSVIESHQKRTGTDVPYLGKPAPRTGGKTFKRPDWIHSCAKYFI
jgi:hypothetical protein